MECTVKNLQWLTLQVLMCTASQQVVGKPACCGAYTVMQYKYYYEL